jgi:hypothetical protein
MPEYVQRFSLTRNKKRLESQIWPTSVTSRPRIDLHGHPSIAGRFSVALGAPSSLAAWRCCRHRRSRNGRIRGAPAGGMRIATCRTSSSDIAFAPPAAAVSGGRFCGTCTRLTLGCSFRALSGYATATLAPSKGRLMRCTVDGLTPNRSAMTRIPGRPGVARASRIRFSSAGAIGGRPSRFPSLLALASPARTRS